MCHPLPTADGLAEAALFLCCCAVGEGPYKEVREIHSIVTALQR